MLSELVVIGDRGIKEQLAHPVGVLDIVVACFQHRPQVTVFFDFLQRRLRPDAGDSLVEVRPTEDGDIDQLLLCDVEVLQRRLKVHQFRVALRRDLPERHRRADQQRIVASVPSRQRRHAGPHVASHSLLHGVHEGHVEESSWSRVGRR